VIGDARMDIKYANRWSVMSMVCDELERKIMEEGIVEHCGV
jgi:hypothetical protein